MPEESDGNPRPQILGSDRDLARRGQERVEEYLRKNMAPIPGPSGPKPGPSSPKPGPSSPKPGPSRQENDEYPDSVVSDLGPSASARQSRRNTIANDGAQSQAKKGKKSVLPGSKDIKGSKVGDDPIRRTSVVSTPPDQGHVHESIQTSVTSAPAAFEYLHQSMSIGLNTIKENPPSIVAGVQKKQLPMIGKSNKEEKAPEQANPNVSTESVIARNEADLAWPTAKTIPGPQSTERTFILIKPDGVQRRLVGEIISRLEKRGFQLIAMKMTKPSEEFAKIHYEKVKRKPYFTGLCEFLSSGPVVAMVWQGDSVVNTVSKIIGRTNPLDSKPGTVRGDYALGIRRNLVDKSDNVERAEHEIALWFNNEEIIQWNDDNIKWLHR